MENQFSESRPCILVIGPSIAYVPLSQGLFSLIDSWNIERVNTLKWCAHYNPKKETYYAVGTVKKNSKIHLHRFVNCTPAGVLTDHRNRSTLDNRECNLRNATHRQNAGNAKGHTKSKSGLKGAILHTPGRWRALISTPQGRLDLGLFSSPEAAHEAYCVAAKEHFGEFGWFE